MPLNTQDIDNQHLDTEEGTAGISTAENRHPINRAVIDAGVCDAMVELAQRTRVDKPCKELSTASVVYGCLYGYRKQVHSGGDAGSEEASPSAGQPNPLSLMDHQCPIRAPMQGGASIHVTGFKRTRRRIADVLAGKYSIPSDSSRGDVVGVFATASVDVQSQVETPHVILQVLEDSLTLVCLDHTHAPIPFSVRQQPYTLPGTLCSIAEARQADLEECSEFASRTISGRALIGSLIARHRSTSPALLAQRFEVESLRLHASMSHVHTCINARLQHLSTKWCDRRHSVDASILSEEPAELFSLLMHQMIRQELSAFLARERQGHHSASDAQSFGEHPFELCSLPRQRRRCVRRARRSYVATQAGPSVSSFQAQPAPAVLFEPLDAGFPADSPLVASQEEATDGAAALVVDRQSAAELGK